jgi:hypothetical protein
MDEICFFQNSYSIFLGNFKPERGKWWVEIMVIDECDPDFMKVLWVDYELIKFPGKYGKRKKERIMAEEKEKRLVMYEMGFKIAREKLWKEPIFLS